MRIYLDGAGLFGQHTDIVFVYGDFLLVALHIKKRVDSH